MKHANFIVGFVLLLLNGFAQQQSIKPCTVGDTLPDFLMTGIVNFGKDSVRTSHFIGKSLLIDFWETWCTGCLYTLPKLDGFQKEFSDSLNIITVTRYAGRNQLFENLNRSKYTSNIQLPVVVKDSVLARYFPHTLISHIIWLDDHLVVKAITGSDSINSRNIRALLDKEKLDWSIKQDLPDFNYDKPILESTTENSEKASIYYSTFTGGINGISSLFTVTDDSIKQIKSINFFNYSFLQFSRQVFENANGGINPKLLLSDDSIKYDKTLYCYSVVLPMNMPKQSVDKFLQDDLRRWLKIIFGLELVKEKRGQAVLKLVTISKVHNIKPAPGLPIQALIDRINESANSFPWIVDYTYSAAKNRVIDIDEIPGNLNALRKLLRVYGFDLLQSHVPLEMYVLRKSKF